MLSVVALTLKNKSRATAAKRLGRAQSRLEEWCARYLKKHSKRMIAWICSTDFGRQSLKRPKEQFFYFTEDTNIRAEWRIWRMNSTFRISRCSLGTLAVTVAHLARGALARAWVY